METLQITRPDDWHIHLRDDDALRTTATHASRYLGRALIMPNLQPPVTTAEAALAYRQRILDNCPAASPFTPLMALYLTDQSSPDEIRQSADSDKIIAAKLYPAGATTHSQSGVKDIQRLYPLFAIMEEVGLVLSIHGEVTDPSVDIFDREKRFIDDHLRAIVDTFPQLRVVLEHITTATAVDFISSARRGVAATITAHHLLLNRNDLFRGGICPHNYCLPLLKREADRCALVNAACAANPRFFYGSDSAPHPRQGKESACGCAGIYTAHAGIELCAEIFSEAETLDRLEGFCSHFGADFYGLPHNTDSITLTASPWSVPDCYEYSHNDLIPFRAGQKVSWKIQEASV